MRWTEPLPFRRGSAREPAKASRREPPNSGARTLRSLSVHPIGRQPLTLPLWYIIAAARGAELGALWPSTP